MALESSTESGAYLRNSENLLNPAVSHQTSGGDSEKRSDGDRHTLNEPMTLNGSNSTVMPDDPEKNMEKNDRMPDDVERPTGADPVTSPALEKDPNLVEFEGPDDPGNPKNWTVARRVGITIALGGMTFVVTFASSIFSVAIDAVSEEFHIGKVTSTLGVSLFILGFVLGPIVFGPLSEVYGRKYPLFAGYIGFAIFQIPVAVAQNVETIMLSRFLGGFAAAAPLAIVGGALVDIWDPVQRAYAMCAFATGGFGGPSAGPIVGGFITESYLGWRWTAWITLIMAALFGVIGFILVPETSSSRILQLRATEMRYKTKNWALHAKADERKITAHKILTVYLFRPFIMIVHEPILALMTAYMSYVYGVIYLLFESFPVSFNQQRGWSLGVSSLPFCSFIVGIVIGCGMMVYSTRTGFRKAYIEQGQIVPEQRLPPMILGAFILPGAFFWFGWTSDPHITWVPQVLSVGVMATGLFLTFWQGMNYIIDCYGPYSNSAIAINTFVRSIAATVFPLFAPIMYHHMGVPWASSLLGFICLIFVPAPIIFYKYGARVRERSKWAPTAND